MRNHSNKTTWLFLNFRIQPRYHFDFSNEFTVYVRTKLNFTMYIYKTPCVSANGKTPLFQFKNQTCTHRRQHIDLDNKPRVKCLRTSPINRWYSSQAMTAVYKLCTLAFKCV